jgi:hypothetical protein
VIKCVASVWWQGRFDFGIFPKSFPEMRGQTVTASRLDHDRSTRGIRLRLELVLLFAMLVQRSDPLEVVSGIRYWLERLVAFRSRSLPSVQAPGRTSEISTRLLFSSTSSFVLSSSHHYTISDTQRISANEYHSAQWLNTCLMSAG